MCEEFNTQFIFYIIKKFKEFIKSEKKIMSYPILTIILEQFFSKDDDDVYRLKNELDSFRYIK